jgi:fluoroacetyl-CoA thioesterase
MSAAFEIPLGVSASEQITVTHELTVAHAVPGMPEVYGTPMMIYLLEVASARAIQKFLPAGWASVGTEVNVRHLAATPVGFVVTASATTIGGHASATTIGGQVRAPR